MTPPFHDILTSPNPLSVADDVTHQTVAEHFAGALSAAGVRLVFGYPGGATVELTEHLHRQGIEFVLTRSETASGYMASAYGDRTGLPGVVLSTLGPGATSLVNPAAHALMDRSPMLIVTGAGAPGRLTHQRLDQVSLFRPVTKWSTAAHPASFESVLHRAWRTACEERPGPVHLDIAGDILGRPCARANGSQGRPLPVQDEVYGPAANVEQAVDLLREARRPLIRAGYSVLRRGGAAALRRFAEAWGVPVITTAKAKGVFPESHPLWAGVTDVAGRNLQNQFIERADLHVAVGFDTIEVITTRADSARHLHVDLRPNLAETYDSDVELLGCIESTLERLRDLSGHAASEWTPAELEQHRLALMAATSILDSGTLTPTAVARVGRRILPEDTVVHTDVGAHKLSMAMHWRTDRPGTFAVSNGLGTMGYGLPASIATKLAEPDRPVACFTGDGGFLMSVAELGTAVEQKALIVVVVFNDGALEHIRLKQQLAGYAYVGTRMQVPDLVQLAESFGALGLRALDETQLAAHLQTALHADRPVVIDTRIDPSEYAVQFEA